MANGPILIDISGSELTEQDKDLLKHPMVGGVVLFFKNCKDEEQLKKLIASIRELKPYIIIAVDREGGNVQRFQKPGFRSFPAARTYGEVYEDTKGESDYWKKFTSRNAEAIGEELRSLDIDVELAPVLDSHSKNPVIGGLDRAFHTNEVARTEIAEVFIQGLKKKGIKATGKHFPDHGVCEDDSHNAKPVSNIDRETLLTKHIYPYQKLIKENKLDVVMPAHVTYTSVDSNNPAGFSKIWLNDILRKELGFQGVVMSDCLSMAGADIGEMKERAMRALEEGCCDMAIMCNQKPDISLGVLNHLQVNLKQNIASQTRITQLLQRDNKTELNTTETTARVVSFSGAMNIKTPEGTELNPDVKLTQAEKKQKTEPAHL